MLIIFSVSERIKFNVQNGPLFSGVQYLHWWAKEDLIEGQLIC